MSDFDSFVAIRRSTKNSYQPIAMRTLDPSTTAKFLDRFYSFNDAVLHTVEIRYMPDGKRDVLVEIATRDAEQTENQGWVSVQIAISQAEDFCFLDTCRSSAQVLSQGVHICWFDGSVGIDFGHFVDQPTNRDELASSKFFAIGSGANWTVKPYSIE